MEALLATRLLHGLEYALELLTNTDQSLPITGNPQHHDTRHPPIFTLRDTWPLVLRSLAVMLEPRDLTEAKRSKIYWEEICLPPTQTTPKLAPKKPSSNSPVITLTKADIDRVKELISPPATLSENLEVPEELAHLKAEDLWRYDPMTWTLRYCTDLMEAPEDAAPEVLPPSLRLVHVRSDAPYNIRNPAALPPIPEEKDTDPQELSHGKQVRANRANSLEGNESFNRHYESDAALRESRNQIARVDQTNSKIKEHIVDLRRKFEAFRAEQKWP